MAYFMVFWHKIDGNGVCYDVFFIQAAALSIPDFAQVVMAIARVQAWPLVGNMWHLVVQDALLDQF